MPTPPPTHSAFPETFRCIGSACEDICCQGWNIPIDRATYEKYQNLPASPLSTLISATIPAPPTQTSEETGGAWNFAQIRIAPNSYCPLLNSERLCSIHAELGHDMLSYSCATYPRIVHEIGGMKDTALALSCPEAARLVLLSPNLPASGSRGVREHPDGNADALPPSFLAIRGSVLDLIRMRSYPLWQRMFLLGLLCRRLDSIARGELNRSVLEFLGAFKRVVATGSLRPAMATLPEDRSAQLQPAQVLNEAQTKTPNRREVRIGWV